MEIILNIIVLLFEVLYYSLFMRYARKEGKFYRYLILFMLITIIGLLIGTNGFISYMFLILMILFGLKYIIRIKTTLFDCLIILLMILLKVVIETVFYIPFHTVLDIYKIGILYSIFKIIIIISLKNKIYNFVNKLKIKWNANNFYIRYTFSILTFIYVITSCIFIILYYIK